MKAEELKTEIIRFFHAFNEDPNDLWILDELINAHAKQYHNQRMEEIMPELFDWIIIFVQKARVVDDPRLDRLFELDDLYQKVYSDNRIRHDFFIAAQMAYMAVFNEIFKSFLKQEEK